MANLRERLPAINGLVTFEAAARHLSFSLAADELCVTQAAVSRQIKRLETQLGQALFIRQPRELSLTLSGIQLQQAVNTGLEHIAMVTANLMQSPVAAKVTVTTTLAFAQYWLSSRLARFRQAYPNVKIKVNATDRFEAAFDNDTDITLSCGDKHPPDMQAYYLFNEVVFPVCSPDYLKHAMNQHARDISLTNLPQHDLLHLDHSHWRDIGWQPIDWVSWLRHAEVVDQQPAQGLCLNNYPMLLQSAIDGAGIALGWEHLVAQLLQEGKLIRPIKQQLDSQRGYYLVTKNSEKLRPEVTLLRNWLIESGSSGSISSRLD